MKGILRIVRDNEVKLTFPVAQVEVKTDGTIWVQNNPVLGITENAEKKRIAALMKARKYDEIDVKYFTRLGDNENGLWAGDDEAWENHPLKAKKEAEKKEREEEEAKTVEIYLSSRGWGDYSSLKWVGDITKPDSEILAECKTKLQNGYDVDNRNQTDSELLDKIRAGRKKWETAPERRAAFEAAEAADIKRKVETGYCFYCESWCHGDCGHYSNDPQTRYKREFKAAVRENDYGVSDW